MLVRLKQFEIDILSSNAAFSIPTNLSSFRRTRRMDSKLALGLLPDITFLV